MFWTLLCIALCLYYIWDWFRHRPILDNISKRCVFVTGCDTGFGHDLALRLDSMGVHTFAGCFTQAGSEKLAAETSENVHTVLLDVSDHDSVRAAYQFVRDHIPAGTELWGLVNNAGKHGQWGPVEFLTRKAFHDLYDVNFFGMVDVTQAFVPLLKESGGRVVNTSSMAAIMSVPTMIPYVTSKHAVRAFSTILRQEKAPYGMKVACVMPGAFNTHIVDIDNNVNQMTSEWEALPDDVRAEYGDDYLKKSIDNWLELVQRIPNADTSPVINAYLHALLAQRPRDEYTPGVEGTVVAMLSHLPSRLAYFLIHTFVLGEKFIVKSRALREKLKQNRQ